MGVIPCPWIERLNIVIYKFNINPIKIPTLFDLFDLELVSLILEVKWKSKWLRTTKTLPRKRNLVEVLEVVVGFVLRYQDHFLKL